MSFRNPREIEVKFKHALGAIGPLMCVADIATSELVSSSSNKEISDLSKKYNHRNLNLEKVELEKVGLYVNLAHIAYINSRAELFCEDVIGFIKKHTGNKESYNVDSVDFLRKSIFQIHARKHNIPKKVKSLSENDYISYSGKEELEVIDYFRKIRNIEFHGGVEKSTPIDADTNEDIFKKFKHRLVAFHQITIRDVILYSMAWQSAAKNICSKLVDIDNDLLVKIKKKYSNDDQERINNAMRQKLSHDYLQPAKVIEILENNGWVA
ncbi:hypothetical protein AT00_09255 [Pseudoalteromonas lipolytica SCSIO 04301]|uniref:hypothetical protein n=1 Tax=Pseudoalteromonas TaxID=53246 RepID=UPI0004473C84|nr:MULTISPECIES: hypothetical protein [Pseudoalteromonas]EWH06635.1 hypothetical protein AT00_09255 [Pseudoalteromonas lipolytica SCSIO 04301]